MSIRTVTMGLSLLEMRPEHAEHLEVTAVPIKLGHDS